MNRLRSEDGWALPTALLLVAMMMTIALATVSFGDQQTKMSGVERTRESSFNLAEGSLNAQLFVLSRHWPQTASLAYPGTCTQAGGGGTQCPDPTTLAANFSSQDYAAGKTWSALVRDDTTDNPDFNAACTVAVPCWDSNGNNHVWVEGTANVHGQVRKVVALVEITSRADAFPNNTVTAGYFQTENNGNKVLIDLQGCDSGGRNCYPGQYGPLRVRCTGAAGSSCLNYRDGQVSPGAGVQQPPTYAAPGDALSDDALDRYRETAQALGTDYAGCPPTLTGRVVMIENLSSGCSFTGNGTYNSAASPGLVIVVQQSAGAVLELSGNTNFYGILYAANRSNQTGILLEPHGNGNIIGSVAVDRGGGVATGSSHDNIRYWDYTGSLAKSYDNAGIVQNSWREVK